MDERRLFLVRVWLEGTKPRAVARAVDSEVSAVFDDALALGCHLLESAEAPQTGGSADGEAP